MLAGLWAFMALKWTAGTSYLMYLKIKLSIQSLTGLAYFSHSYRQRLIKDQEYRVF